MRKLTLFLSLVLLSASATRAENPPEPTALSATVSANLVTIANCSVGKPVILFGVMREPQRYHSRLSRPAVTATADASGAVTFDIGTTIPVSAAFVAVDFMTGRYVLATRTDGSFVEMPELNDVSQVVTQTSRVVMTRGMVDMLLVRPDKGAWSLRTGDGHPTDESPTRGQFVRSLDGMRLLLGPDPTPHNARPGDVIAIFDGRQLEYMVAVIGAGRSDKAVSE